MTATGIGAALLSGFAEFAEFFHYGLDEFFGVGEFRGDHAEVHGGDGGIPLAGAIDAVLADEDQRICDAVERHSEAATIPPEALLRMFQLVVMLFKRRHGSPSISVAHPFRGEDFRGVGKTVPGNENPQA